ncbi:site-specific integrase [Paenibacillus sp. TAB 01]|uniref:site-specific integrase n=1 Tax=Paenibacillus sp. TAB 01 TaxID=3368988 RepID=UPI0037535629
MNFVQPIRDREMIELIKNFLMKQSYRNYMMFVFGINTGLRIQDILKHRVMDVMGVQIVMHEMKTGKRKIIEINPTLRRELDKYITYMKMKPTDYLFPSRQGGKGNKPIGRDMAYKIMRAAAREHNLVDIGTHTMRKTFGYHMYDKTKDITLVRKLLNHSDDSSTMSYIGLDQDAMNKAMKQFGL